MGALPLVMLEALPVALFGSFVIVSLIRHARADRRRRFRSSDAGGSDGWTADGDRGGDSGGDSNGDSGGSDSGGDGGGGSD